MNKETSDKLSVISDYVRHQTPFWNKEIKNFAGVHVGQKIKAGNYLNYYAIVFHVLEKPDLNSLRDRDRIPKFCFIPQGRKTIKVPTDVMESKGLELKSNGIQPGEGTFPLNLSDRPGTIGFFLESLDQTELYFCSNMHVLAPDILAKRKTSYYKPIPRQTRADVTIFDTNGSAMAFLEKALFDGIDIAVARVKDRNIVENFIPENGIPSGVVDVTPQNFRRLRIGHFGLRSKSMDRRIIGFEANIPTHIRNVFMNDLIVADLPTDFGDSGSPVFDEFLNLVGIVMGSPRDNPSLTFIIPIRKIISFAGMNPLIKRTR